MQNYSEKEDQAKRLQIKKRPGDAIEQQDDSKRLREEDDLDDCELIDLK